MKQESKTNKVLLISNSTLYGGGYLDHAESEIRDFLGNVKNILFVPFALYDRDAYALMARERFQKMNYDLTSIHTIADAAQAVKKTNAIFIGGGNTFRLLKALYDFELLHTIQRSVDEGMPYIGSSAGAIVAGPTIKTSKDMPIVQPVSFNSLGIITFQISPHYLDPDPNSTHMGETQEERISQFLEENDAPVVGLREGTMLRVERGSITLKGTTDARIFRKGQTPVEIGPGLSLDHLLSSTLSFQEEANETRGDVNTQA